MKYWLIFIVLISHNLYSQNVHTNWDFVIKNPNSCDMYIGDVHILNVDEFGKLSNKDTTFAFEVYFRIYAINDTLIVSCSDVYNDCNIYKYQLSKKIITEKKDILNKKFRLKFIGKDYIFSIKINPKHGNYILFYDDKEMKKYFERCMYLQNTEPFLYGSPPKRKK